jgi:hypothetical protein
LQGKSSIFIEFLAKVGAMMKPQKSELQKMLYSFSVRLADLLDHRHPLYALADRIEWSCFDEAFEPMYCGDNRVPAIRFGIPLRQSYLRKGKHAFIGYHRYAAARQYKRAKKPLKQLKTYLGRVIRDLERNLLEQPAFATFFQDLLDRAKRILTQQRHDSPKLYSVHAPETECISKGKVHKKYEFGCKVGLVTTARRPFILGIQAFHGNPYDGHTLTLSLQQAER